MNNIELYSFDIFDTLITRKVANPTGIFILMQNELNKNPEYKDFSDDIKTNFFQYRRQAEFRQRRINRGIKNNIDISFDDIYRDIKACCALSEEQTKNLKELEIKLELENIIPIEENVNKIKKLLSENRRVVLISDMYLPEDIIKQMLLKCDPILCEPKLYLSSTLGYMKSSRAMYKHVLQEEKINPKNWLHMGDNLRVDFKRPKKFKINAKHYNAPCLKDYETDIIAKYNNPLTQYMFGCSKNLRNEITECSKYFELGMNLAGEIFYPYVFWLLNRAKELGIKRLYFIARDGFILKEIADIIIENLNFNIETKYIYGSRKSWREPAISYENLPLLKQMLWYYITLSKNLSQNFKINSDELRRMFPENYFDKKRFNYNEIMFLIDYFIKDKKLIDCLIDRNKSDRENTIGYLKQEINCSDDSFAFVELDGSGLTQNCLAELMRNFYGKPIKTFYMMGTPMMYEGIMSERLYFYQLIEPFVGTIFELFTKAPHGQTLGYEFKTNKYEPILEDVSKNLNIESDNEYLNGIKTYSKRLSEYLKQNPYITSDCCFIIDKYVDLLSHKISPGLISLMQILCNSAYSKEELATAPKLNIFNAIEFFFRKKTKTKNVTISKIRSSKLVRNIIDYRQSMKLKKVRNA